MTDNYGQLKKGQIFTISEAHSDGDSKMLAQTDFDLRAEFRNYGQRLSNYGETYSSAIHGFTRELVERGMASWLHSEVVMSFELNYHNNDLLPIGYFDFDTWRDGESLVGNTNPSAEQRARWAFSVLLEVVGNHAAEKEEQVEGKDHGLRPELKTVATEDDFNNVCNTITMLQEQGWFIESPYDDYDNSLFVVVARNNPEELEALHPSIEPSVSLLAETFNGLRERWLELP